MLARARTYTYAYVLYVIRAAERDGKSLAISSLLIIFPAKAKELHSRRPQALHFSRVSISLLQN